MTLRLENVTKRVGAETHLYDVHLELAPGALYVLFGLTLAGKTSLMRLMAGLDRPTSGRVLVDGRDVTGADVRRRDVAMVYQQFINYPSFTVYDNIASPLRRKGLSRAEVDRRVREAAATVHIDGLLDRLPAELSGGQQQRTPLARALVKEASLLLLDEPLVNLDYKLREEMRAELQAIFRRREAIVVYATTEPLEALMLGGHTIVLDKGRVLQTGRTLDVYHRPASVRITQVFSEPPMNLIDGTIEGRGEFRLGRTIRGPLTANLQGVPPGRYRFGVRANHVVVRRDRPDDIEVGARVELAEVSGSETFVHVRHNDASWIVQLEGVHPLSIGDPLPIYVKPRRLFVFDSENGRLVRAPEIAGRPMAAAE
jgi:glycerol transport system ATP-binding protein